MAIQRRRMLTAALGGAFSASLLTAGRVDAAPAPVFEKPTADNPIIACYNENPLGLSAAARKAVADSAAVANRYPFVRCEVLRKACAQLIGGKPEEIVLSQGSAEAIRASVEAHNGPGASLVTAELTYSDGQMAAVRNNIPVIKVKMGLNWSMDIPAMKAAAAERTIRPPRLRIPTHSLTGFEASLPILFSFLTRPMPNLWRISLTAQLPNLFAKVSTTSLC